jgi:hypothetical protein
VFVPDEDGPGDLGEAEDAAYELLAHAVGALRPATSDAGVAFLRSTGPGAPRWDSDN